MWGYCQARISEDPSGDSKEVRLGLDSGKVVRPELLNLKGGKFGLDEAGDEK